MLVVSMATRYFRKCKYSHFSFELKMEHWDAWLAEDMFREMASAEGSPESYNWFAICKNNFIQITYLGENSSSTIMLEKKRANKKVKAQKKLKPKGKAAKNSNEKLDLSNLEEGENDSQTSPIYTPKRGKYKIKNLYD